MGTLAVYAVILYGKHYFRKMSGQDLALKYKGQKWASPLQARNKYPDVDVFSLQPIFFRLGLVFALALNAAGIPWVFRGDRLVKGPSGWMGGDDR